MSPSRYTGTVTEIAAGGEGAAWLTLATDDGRTLAWKTADEETARRVQDRIGVGDRVTVWVKDVGPHERVTTVGPAPEAGSSATGGQGTPLGLLVVLVVGAAAAGVSLGQWLSPLLYW